MWYGYVQGGKQDWFTLRVDRYRSSMRAGRHPREGRYPGLMSGQTRQLLEAFDALAAEEKRIFTAELLRKTIPFDSGPLDDLETADAADSLFAMLDAEENDARSR